MPLVLDLGRTLEPDVGSTHLTVRVLGGPIGAGSSDGQNLILERTQHLENGCRNIKKKI